MCINRTVNWKKMDRKKIDYMKHKFEKKALILSDYVLCSIKLITYTQRY